MNYQSSFYVVQQLVSRLLYINFYSQQPFFIFSIFLSGILTGINPCIVSMFPILLTYSNEIKDKNYNFIFFILGILITQLSFGLFLSFFGYTYFTSLIIWPFLSAILYVFLGLVILQIFYINIRSFKWTFKIIDISNTNIKAFIFGGLFVISTIPCIFPILLTVLNILFTINNSFLLFVYSLFYFLGYICPIVLFYYIFQQVKKINIFPIFIFGKIYSRLGGFFLMSSGIFNLLRTIFYKY